MARVEGAAALADYPQVDVLIFWHEFVNLSTWGGVARVEDYP